ncbi:autotransporter-associated beta strand repeat-containing protein, partial [Pollutimonas bauzanensis]|uniref:beta strand repeat-containing protein n=1 Tax=Pollutimonas bauzanensis TaxID=658167 RepID=UPI003340C834
MLESTDVNMGYYVKSASKSTANWHDALVSSRILRGGRMTKWKGIVVSCAPHMAGVLPLVLQTVSSRILPGVLLLGLAAGPAAAADVYWDVNGGSPGQGGSGTWNLSDVTWNQSSDGVAGPFRAWDNVALDTAVFGGTAGTVTVGGALNAGGLTFTTANYTLNGGTVTLGGASPTIAVASGNATINSTIAGNTGVTKSGAGNLILNNANTFSGGLRVGAGALTVNSDSALGAAGNGVTMAGGSALNSTGVLNANRVVTLEGGTVDIYGTGVGSAKFTGAGALRVDTNVTLSNDASDFTGDVTFVANGSASFTSVGNVGEASSLGAGNTVTFVARDQFADRLFYKGDGDSSNRNWEFAQSGGTSGAILVNGGTGTLTLTGDINSVLISSRSMIFEAQAADLELLGVISSTTGGPISFNGGSVDRSITLGGANTYTGITSIDKATVHAASLADTGVASSFGTGTTGGITIINGGTVSYTGTGDNSNRSWTIGAGGGILNNGTGALGLGGDIVLNATAINRLTLGGSYAGVNTLSGTVSGPGDLVMDGGAGSVWALSGTNTRSGAVTVEGGTLRADSATAFGTTSNVTVNGGSLDLNGFDLATQALAGSGGTIALG